jgi:hypothetical protein
LTCRFDLRLHELLHLDVEIEMRLVGADPSAGDRRSHDCAQQVQRSVKAHVPVPALPVELRSDT